MVEGGRWTPASTSTTFTGDTAARTQENSMFRRIAISTAAAAAALGLGALSTPSPAQARGAAQASPPIVLHAARLFEVDPGRIVSPGELLVEGGRIQAAGTSVPHPAGAKVIDLGDRTLMPGLIDVHVHLFLHPAPPSEGMQTVDESAPQRTIEATLAARADLMAGFTSERDMGTEGAGPADAAVRNAIESGEIPGPRL